jgi:hypothetical protein
MKFEYDGVPVPKKLAKKVFQLWYDENKEFLFDADIMELDPEKAIELALESEYVIHEGDGTEDDTPIFLSEHTSHTLSGPAWRAGIWPPKKCHE